MDPRSTPPAVADTKTILASLRAARNSAYLKAIFPAFEQANKFIAAAQTEEARKPEFLELKKEFAEGLSLLAKIHDQSVADIKEYSPSIGVLKLDKYEHTDGQVLGCFSLTKDGKFSDLSFFSEKSLRHYPLLETYDDELFQKLWPVYAGFRLNVMFDGFERELYENVPTMEVVKNRSFHMILRLNCCLKLYGGIFSMIAAKQLPPDDVAFVEERRQHFLTQIMPQFRVKLLENIDDDKIAELLLAFIRTRSLKLAEVVPGMKEELKLFVDGLVFKSKERLARAVAFEREWKRSGLGM